MRARRQERAERGWEAWALKVMGEVASHPDFQDCWKAEESYRNAFAIAAELDMRPLAAHCHAGFGKLYKRTGQRDQAQQHLSAATTMFREMDMHFWLDKAEAALTD